MMDFDNILDIASQNQGVSNVQKRYSLQAGPSKRDPRSKGVNPTAVQALLKKRFHDTKKKESEMKKQKEALLAKRVELKSDRKARAMASRTKDNFKGYNGVPVSDSPNKRRTKLEMQEERAMDEDSFRNTSVEDDEDNYEYEQSDSEPDQEPEPLRAGKTIASGVKPSSRKPSAPSKPPLAFADLLKLAEKKQHEPVELKAKVVKKEDRPRTADEMRELELERKAKRQGKDRETDRDRPQSSSNSVKKSIMERDQKSGRPLKNTLEKPSLPSGSSKRPHQTKNMDKGPSSSKIDRDRPRVSQNDKARPKTSLSGPSGTVNKLSSKAASSQMSAKQGPSMNSASQKSSTQSDLKLKKVSSSSLQRRTPSISGNRPPSETGQKFQQGNTKQTRPSQGGPSKQGPPAGGRLSGKGESVRPGMNSALKTGGNSQIHSLSGPPRAENQREARPGAAFRTKANVPQVRSGGRAMHAPLASTGIRAPGVGSSQSGGGGSLPGRSTSSIGSGPGRPKCTVVSETISSKNVGGSRPGVPRPGVPQPGVPRPGVPRPGVPPRMGMPQRPGMPLRPGMPPRSMMNRPPGTMLPPITSAYKRKYEDEEYDSEMDDFIDDEGEEHEEISRHIKEIFGYDRSRYKDESDYALKFMESSWKEMQKEEARSLRMAVHEDLEEERREQDELKSKTKRKKLN